MFRYQARQAKLELDEKNIYRFGMGLNTVGLKDTSATTNMNKRQKEVIEEQLHNEEKTIASLKNTYKQALKDCEQKIRELSARTDMENLQSIIYQKQYQEALKAQLEGALSNLQSNSYATVSDYLTKCYRDGYTGVMYDLQQTGIPIIMPIDQVAVARVIQTDSKLSKSLYDKMGEDVTYLKKAVRAEVSRGIANGSTWNEVAGKLSRHMANTPFQRAYNNSIRIARTEGHRIQVQSAMDAQKIAKSKGADIVKQWDSTLDGNTRNLHRLLDGQIREVDEPFEVANLKVEAPGMFGLASEDCNCRCCLLQRARWALDDEELETLRKRAEYFGLDKTTDFEEYQTKYLGITQEDIDNIKNSVKIKKIELPSETDNIKGMSNETKQAICDAFDKVKEEYNVSIKNMELESLGNGNERVPFQYVPENIGGFLKYRLVINTDYDFNGSLDAFSARIMRNHNNGFLSSENVEDLIAHEMAHILTFQNCDTFGMFIRVEEEVREKFIKGVSAYADSTYDGAETIAEAFVKYRKGERLPDNVMSLLEKYVLKKEY